MKTYPEDVVALGASSGYLHALRTPHALTILRLFGCFMAAYYPPDVRYLDASTHRVHVAK